MSIFELFIVRMLGASIDASKKRALANLRSSSRRFGLPRLSVLPTATFIIQLVFAVTLRKDTTRNAFIW